MVKTTSSSASSAGGSRTQLAVRSKEDLKALAHVRKMMRGDGYEGQRDTLLDFLGAESPVRWGHRARLSRGRY
jgi:hypothetical protein